MACLRAPCNTSTRYSGEHSGDRLEGLYTVALALGLRQGEALGLRWQDVDLDTGALRVRMSLQPLPRDLRPEGAPRGTRLVLVEPKTARSRRTVTMPAVVVSALRQHRVQQLQERLLAGSRWHDWGVGIHLHHRDPDGSAQRLAPLPVHPRGSGVAAHPLP